MKQRSAEDDLDRWMARLADGERGAFDPLFRALHPRAVQFARVSLGDAYAQDVAQSTMTQLFAHAHDFTPGRAVVPWFYAIAINEVRATRRRTMREVDADTWARTAVAPDDPEREAIERELVDALERAIATLDEASAEAICAALGRSAAPPIHAMAFRKRLSRAYAKLRVLLRGLDAT